MLYCLAMYLTTDTTSELETNGVMSESGLYLTSELRGDSHVRHHLLVIGLHSKRRVRLRNDGFQQLLCRSSIAHPRTRVQETVPEHRAYSHSSFTTYAHAMSSHSSNTPSHSLADQRQFHSYSRQSLAKALSQAPINDHNHTDAVSLTEHHSPLTEWERAGIGRCRCAQANIRSPYL